MPSNSMSMGAESTMESYIEEYNREDIVYSKFYNKQVIPSEGKKLVMNFDPILTKYYHEIRGLRTKQTLSDTEYRRYRFNPKLLSFDLYGTTELWFLILEANELTNQSQFDMRTIWVYDTRILDILSRVLNIEQESINYNDAEVEHDLLSTTEIS